MSQSAQKGYGFYECESSAGLSEYNKPHYLKLRDDFNARTVKDDSYYVTFYVLIVYAFNNQIRFNSSGKYNLPVGKRDFNKHMEEKLLQYAKIIKKQDSIFECRDFRNFDCKELSENDFVYADPPYLITCAAYNEKMAGQKKTNAICLTCWIISILATQNLLCRTLLNRKAKKSYPPKMVEIAKKI